jgi:curved DNA-binding protein CbpA
MFRTGQGTKPGRRLALYEKLGVSPNSSAAEICAAYEVLERAYRPGGAYLDDVMHGAFMDISNAAALLRDPKDRKLYDLGYIDEAGRTTEFGRAHAKRRKRGLLLATLLIAGLAGFFAAGPEPDAEMPRSASASSAPPKTGIEAKLTTALDAPAAAPSDPKIEKAAPAIESHHAEPYPQRAQADSKDYLPAAAPAFANGPPDAKAPAPPRRQAMVRPAEPNGKAKRETPARDTEREPRPRLVSKEPSGWQSYIWLGGPPPSQETVLASQTKRSARCLACLTDPFGDCGKSCR